MYLFVDISILDLLSDFVDDSVVGIESRVSRFVIDISEMSFPIQRDRVNEVKSGEE